MALLASSIVPLAVVACATAPARVPVMPERPRSWVYPELVSAGDALEVRFYKRNRLDSESYRVEIGDVLRVEVVDHAEATSGEVTVLPDGRVSLSLVGSLEAAGRTCEEIAQEAAVVYAGARIRDPRVVVSVVKGQQRLSGFLQGLGGDPGSGRIDLKVYDEAGLDLPLIPNVKIGRPLADMRQEIKSAYAAEFGEQLEVTVNLSDRVPPSVYVMGEVKRPGAVELVPGAALLDVVAKAGGFTETSDTGEVLVIRNHEDGTYESWKLELDELLAGSEATVFVPERNDVVYVSRSGIASANLFVQQYIRGLLPFNLGLGVAVPTK